jgi:hypothetical protein
MTAPDLTFVLTRRRKQKTRLVGRVVVAAVRRALTHHSWNGANNQRNGDGAAVHLTENDLAMWLLSIAIMLGRHVTLQITFYLLHRAQQIALVAAKCAKKAIQAPFSDCIS